MSKITEQKMIYNRLFNNKDNPAKSLTKPKTKFSYKQLFDLAKSKKAFKLSHSKISGPVAWHPSERLETYLNTAFAQWMLLFSMLPTAAAEASTYLFEDLQATVYQLWFSGEENFESVVTDLKNGQCDVRSTIQQPNQFSFVQGYFDTSGTQTPVYEVILSCDSTRTPNQKVVDCVSGLLEQAHEANQSNEFPLTAVLAVLGSVLALAMVAGGVAFYCHRKSKRSSEEDQMPNETDTLKMGSIKGASRI